MLQVRAAVGPAATSLRLQKVPTLLSVPASLSRLSELRVLGLRDCMQLESFAVTAIDGLTSLEELDLSLCISLKALPDGTCALPRLKRIFLNHCSSLAALPREMYKLGTLQVLYMMSASSLAPYDESGGKEFPRGCTVVWPDEPARAARREKEYTGERNAAGLRHTSAGSFGTQVGSIGPDASAGYYMGEWADDKPNGTGTYVWPIGDVVLCDWRNGNMHGHAIHMYADGGRFQGTMLDSKRNGKGVFRYHFGDSFIGNYIGDLKNRGIWCFASGEAKATRFEDHESRTCSLEKGVGVKWDVKRARAWKLVDGQVKEEISLKSSLQILRNLDLRPRVPPANESITLATAFEDAYEG